MAAIVAPLDVAAKSGGTATFDRNHRPPPRGGQRRAIQVTKRRAEMAEDIRHFQRLVGHGNRASGGDEIQYGWRGNVERFQRTGRRADLAGGDHEIPSCGAQIAMTE
jgi:hypothetical protein